MSAPMIPLPPRPVLSDAEMLDRIQQFYARVCTRRTVRDFSPDPVPRAVIETALRAAGTAPSGANKQPWTFVAVANPEVKRRIREAAEEEEKLFYGGRAGDKWLADLEPFATTWRKPFLETAPWLIVAFQQNYSLDPETGEKHKNYYVPESASLACALLLAALHEAGLVALTHTPSPMGFLREVLKRPTSEKAIMVIVAGRPAPDARVPDIQRKTLDQIAVFHE